jgi:hypothetical protein
MKQLHSIASPAGLQVISCVVVKLNILLIQNLTHSGSWMLKRRSQYNGERRMLCQKSKWSPELTNFLITTRVFQTTWTLYLVSGLTQWEWDVEVRERCSLQQIQKT